MERRFYKCPGGKERNIRIGPGQHTLGVLVAPNENELIKNGSEEVLCPYHIKEDGTPVMALKIESGQV